jgi:hypothetical protein
MSSCPYAHAVFASVDRLDTASPALVFVSQYMFSSLEASIRNDRTQASNLRYHLVGLKLRSLSIWPCGTDRLMHRYGGMPLMAASDSCHPEAGDNITCFTDMGLAMPWTAEHSFHGRDPGREPWLRSEEARRCTCTLQLEQLLIQDVTSVCNSARTCVCCVGYISGNLSVRCRKQITMLLQSSTGTRPNCNCLQLANTKHT